MPTIFAALIRQAKDHKWWRITTSDGYSGSFINGVIKKILKRMLEKQ